MKAGVTLTDDWLFENVVPNIRRRFPNDTRLCRVLATALLFGAMDPQVGEEFLPATMRERITTAYVPTHPEIAQPVQRVPLTIYRVQDSLMIDKMPQFGDNGAAPAAAGRGPVNLVANKQQHAQVLINVQSLQQAVAQNHQQLTDSIAALRTWAQNQFCTVNQNIRAHGDTIIRKMSGMFHSESHVCVVWGNKTPSRDVFFQSSFIDSQ
jgi:hypothetical protein